jgi:hypothetical protein
MQVASWQLKREEGRGKREEGRGMWNVECEMWNVRLMKCRESLTCGINKCTKVHGKILQSTHVHNRTISPNSCRHSTNQHQTRPCNQHDVDGWKVPSSHLPILPSSHPPILPSSHPPILPSSHLRQIPLVTRCLPRPRGGWQCTSPVPRGIASDSESEIATKQLQRTPRAIFDLVAPCSSLLPDISTSTLQHQKPPIQASRGYPIPAQHSTAQHSTAYARGSPLGSADQADHAKHAKHAAAPPTRPTFEQPARGCVISTQRNKLRSKRRPYCRRPSPLHPNSSLKKVVSNSPLGQQNCCATVLRSYERSPPPNPAQRTSDSDALLCSVPSLLTPAGPPNQRSTTNSFTHCLARIPLLRPFPHFIPIAAQTCRTSICVSLLPAHRAQATPFGSCPSIIFFCLQWLV